MKTSIKKSVRISVRKRKLKKLLKGKVMRKFGEKKKA